MYIRHIRPENDRMSISEIYERSWMRIKIFCRIVI